MLPPRVPLVAPPLHTSLHCKCLFLVGCCFSNIHRRLYKATTYFCIYICSTLSSLPQTMVCCHPTRSVQVARPPNYPPHRDCGLLTFGWLLRSMFKRRPPKAETLPLSLFFEGFRFGTPNKGTNNDESASNAASLLWAHREQRRQDLVPWRILPWREGAKAAEG